MMMRAKFLLPLTLMLFGFMALSLAHAQPAPYTDPPGYPGLWPADFSPGCVNCWRPYTFYGQNASDPAGSADRSTGGTTPQQEADIVNDNNGIAFYYFGDGTNLYFRFVLNGPPGNYTGSGQPYKSTNWSVLIDINGDGYRDFAIMLFGADSGAQPDDLIVMYNTTKSQAVSVPVDTIWRQDSAMHRTPALNNTIDGLPGGTTDWNHNTTDPFVYDFRRTRVVQIDRNLSVNNQNARYYLDLQIPIAALDATSRGGPRLAPQSVISFAATTANSNTNPAQKDFLYPGDYVFTNVNNPLPMGDNIRLDGQPPILKPSIPEVVAGICSVSTPVSAAVNDTLEVWGSNQLRTTVRQVEFYYLRDLNNDGVPSPGEEWLPINTVTMTATPTTTTVTGGTVTENISPWNTTWNPTALPQGQYLIKAVARDVSNLVSDSSVTTGELNNPEGYRVAIFQNTCGVPQADLALSKTASPSPLVAGQNVTYTLTLRNLGPNTASSVVLSDVLPAETSFVSCGVTTTTGPVSGATCGGEGNNRTVTFSSLGSGAVATVTLVAQVNPNVGSGTVITNTATVTSATQDPNPANNTATVTSTTTARADLAITKTASPSPLVAGQNVTYTITVNNLGPSSAQSVVVSDALPAETTFVSCAATLSGVCGGTGNNRTVSFATLPAGATATITLVASVNPAVPQGATTTNTATVTSATPDPNTANNTATVTSQVVTQVDLTISKTASQQTVFAGQALAFTITVANTGASTATNVVVTDPLPPGLSFVSCSATVGSCTLAGTTVTASIGNLAPGATATITLNTLVPPTVTTGQSVINTATVSSANFPTRSATATVTVGGVSVSGSVYHDLQPSGTLDPGESWTGGATVYVKLSTRTGATCNAPALAVREVTPADGAYSLSGLAPGDYCLIVSANPDPNDLTPSAPSGWVFVQPATGVRSITLGAQSLTGQDFGLFFGSRVSGRVFYDDGLAGGAANNALQDGGELGIANVTVTATVGVNARTVQTNAEGLYVIYIPGAWGAGVALSHALQPATGHNLAGGSIYLAQNLNDPAASRFTATLPSGSILDGLNFGVVRASRLTPDGAAEATSPGTATFRHLYRPGTLGTVGLSAAGRYGYSFFIDANCDGVVEPEPVTTFVVDGTWPREPDGRLRACALEVVVTVPAGEAAGTVDVALIEAVLRWANNPQVLDRQQVINTTTLTDAGLLELVKAVRNVTQETGFGVAVDGYSGDVLEYRIAYRNTGTQAITQVRVSDPVPAYTQVERGAYGEANDIQLQCPDGSPRFVGLGEDLRFFEVDVMALCGIPALGAAQEGVVLYRVRID